MMMSANLVGFVIGTEGIKFFLGELFGTLQGQSVRVSIYLGDIQIRLYRPQVPHRGSGLPFCWRADHV